MKTLLIDNYDSFTYNLYQYLSEINGGNTIVIKNDEMTYEEICKLDIDNVVISPGPGNPDREADFGVCREVIQKMNVPILGICLGHQGIGSIYGSHVVNAKEVMHGRISRVYHNNHPLFHGIGQGFEAVRYHSLMLNEINEDLEKIAWCEDGTIMGIACKGKPVYGVQFHPESIKTQYGKKLLSNFKWIVDSYVSKEWFEEKKEFELIVREYDTEIDLEDIFTKYYKDNKNVIWLDSSKIMKDFSRFSYLGCLDGPFSYVVQYDVNKTLLKVVKDGKEFYLKESIFDFLERQLRNIEIHQEKDATYPFAFKCGYAGYFGYEMKADCGYETKLVSGYPDSVMFFLDRLIVYDHVDKKLYLAALSLEHTKDLADLWLKETEEKIIGSMECNETKCFREKESKDILFPYRFDREKDQYIQDIHECFEKIHEGESYEICLTNTLYCKAAVDAARYYLYMRKRNPAPYGCYMKFDDIAVASASIERFLKISGERVAETKPMKGTCKRSPDPVLDDKLKLELERDEKNQAENLMICDLCRNDLGRVCKVGSVKVDKLMFVETYATVHQMISTVCGTLRDEVSCIECIKSLFPGGSMTGAPKKRTLEIIESLEKKARGIYSGNIGYLSLDGTVDLDIVIRTAVITPETVEIGVGGAITALSDAEEEFEEIVLKSKALVEALNEVL